MREGAFPTVLASSPQERKTSGFSLWQNFCWQGLHAILCFNALGQPGTLKARGGCLPMRSVQNIPKLVLKGVWENLLFKTTICIKLGSYLVIWSPLPNDIDYKKLKGLDLVVDERHGKSFLCYNMMPRSWQHCLDSLQRSGRHPPLYAAAR
eukprot:925245-Pelagomonas_calceolata.AAC.5